MSRRSSRLSDQPRRVYFDEEDANDDASEERNANNGEDGTNNFTFIISSLRVC